MSFDIILDEYKTSSQINLTIRRVTDQSYKDYEVEIINMPLQNSYSLNSPKPTIIIKYISLLLLLSIDFEMRLYVYLIC